MRTASSIPKKSAFAVEILFMVTPFSFFLYHRKHTPESLVGSGNYL